jgi:hypothetical protein
LDYIKKIQKDKKIVNKASETNSKVQKDRNKKLVNLG